MYLPHTAHSPIILRFLYLRKFLREAFSEMCDAPPRVSYHSATGSNVFMFTVLMEITYVCKSIILTFPVWTANTPHYISIETLFIILLFHLLYFEQNLNPHMKLNKRMCYQSYSRIHSLKMISLLEAVIAYYMLFTLSYIPSS